MMGKILGAALCLTAIFTSAGAQELGIQVNGGWQGAHYPLESGAGKPLPGGSLGLNYAYRLDSRWSLLSGLAVGLYRTRATLQDGHVFTYDQVDDAGSAFEYHLNFTGYKETQRFFAASIPVLLQYHTDDAGTQWYVDGGIKIFFPFSSSIEASAQKLVLSGYYPDLNLEVSNLPQHGFGTINDWKSSTTSRMKPAVALSAATGILSTLSAGRRLYTGLYVDLGLTDLNQKNDVLPLVAYNPTTIQGVQANSVLNTQNAGRVKLLSFGLEIRLSFGSAAKKRPAPVPAAPVTQPASIPADIDANELEVIQRPIVFGLLGETTIPEAQRTHLDQVANILKHYPTIRISIVGHICNDEKETESARTGAARAQAVARYLRNKGINAGRMVVSSVNESDPVLADPSANYENRRVVITAR